MSAFIDRCRGLIQNRGVFGFIKFVLKSIVRPSQDIVFDRDLSDVEKATVRTIDERFAVYLIDKSNIEDSQLVWLLDQALASENSIYREGLKEQDLLVAITLEGELVHTSFVQFDSSYKKVLNEFGCEPLIGNCWTSPNCRGKGLYPYAINQCCMAMGARGIGRILISCAPDNMASVAGIEKGGFEHVRRVVNFLILTKLLVQKVTDKSTTKLKVGLL